MRFFTIHSVAKYQKMKGGPFGDFKKFSIKKTKNVSFVKCVCFHENHESTRKNEKCQRHVISDIEREDSQTAAHEINRDNEPNATKDETIRSSRKNKYIYHINKGNAKKLKGGPLVSPSTICYAEKQEKLF